MWPSSMRRLWFAAAVPAAGSTSQPARTTTGGAARAEKPSRMAARKTTTREKGRPVQVMGVSPGKASGAHSSRAGTGRRALFPGPLPKRRRIQSSRCPVCDGPWAPHLQSVPLSAAVGGGKKSVVSEPGPLDSRRTQPTGFSRPLRGDAGGNYPQLSRRSLATLAGVFASLVAH
jgi:hypothetical protein